MTKANALMHPCIVMLCVRYSVNLALYTERELVAPFELGSKFPWVRLSCIPGVHWRTFMLSDATLAEMLNAEFNAIAMVEASDALYARTLISV